jgi:protein-S-isoprenylcysteine O-methyltransferase Ste14
MAKAFWRILWQTLAPFNERPEPPEDPPQPSDVDEKQVEQCQKIFDDVETTRDNLEQKARATFTMVAFLTPLIASFFAFVFGRTTPDFITQMVAICFAGASSLFLLLAFISIARAVSVRSREKLFLGSVLDFEKKKFRKYDRAFQVRGLLYCSSVNQAMNDHIAQFVKGAHILTAIAVVMLVIAAVPAAMLFSTQAAPTKAEIVGQVNISSAALMRVQSDIENISRELSLLASDKTRDEWVARLDSRVEQLVATMREIKVEIERLRTKPNDSEPSRPDPRGP